MYFIDSAGKIKEGIPLTDEQKKTLDQLVCHFHNSVDVCGGYHSPYNEKCMNLAIATVTRFSVIQHPHYIELLREDEPVVVEAPPQSEPILAPDDIPF